MRTVPLSCVELEGARVSQSVQKEMTIGPRVRPLPLPLLLGRWLVAAATLAYWARRDRCIDPLVGLRTAGARGTRLNAPLWRAPAHSAQHGVVTHKNHQHGTWPLIALTFNCPRPRSDRPDRPRLGLRQSIGSSVKRPALAAAGRYRGGTRRGAADSFGSTWSHIGKVCVCLPSLSEEGTLPWA